MANTATKIDWDCAVTKKHIEEAEAVGLTLIGVGRTTQHRTYRFDDCDHEQEILIGCVRNNVFRCGRCLQDNLKKEADEAGFKLIGVGRNRRYRKYRCIKCNNEMDHSTSGIRKKVAKCSDCQKAKKAKKKANPKKFFIQKKIDWNEESTKKHIEDAEEAGFKLIGAGRDRRYRKYRCIKCNYEMEKALSAIRNNNARCDECRKIKLKKRYKSRGLTLLGDGRSDAYKILRIDKCGHIQEIHRSAVLVNSYVCSICEETARDLPSKVYLLKITVDTVIQPLSWLKLGYAKTVSTRIKQYGLPSDAIIERLKVMDFETGRQANRYEASLHTKYLRKRLPIKIMKEFLSFSGYKECYPLEMLDTLMKDLEAKEKRMKK